MGEGVSSLTPTFVLFLVVWSFAMFIVGAYFGAAIANWTHKHFEDK